MSDKLVVASRNAHKLAELVTLLQPLGRELCPVSDFSDETPEETGLSFVENAIIKARHAARVSGLPALADDSGLEVEALRGAPGVRSARYAGDKAGDDANNLKLLDALSGVPPTKRNARFVSVIVYLRHAADPAPIIAQGLWEGRILTTAQGQQGFGYDPLFEVPDYGCSAAALPPGVKNRISHRARANAALLAAMEAETTLSRSASSA